MPFMPSAVNLHRKMNVCMGQPNWHPPWSTPNGSATRGYTVFTVSQAGRRCRARDGARSTFNCSPQLDRPVSESNKLRGAGHYVHETHPSDYRLSGGCPGISRPGVAVVVDGAHTRAMADPQEERVDGATLKDRIVGRGWQLFEPIDAAYDRGEIDLAEWHRRVGAIIGPAYLAAADPRGQ